MENMNEPAPYVEGKTTIAPEVLLTIARLTTVNVNGVSRICHLPSAAMRKLFKRGHVDEGVAIEIIDGVVYADIYVILEHDYNVREVSHSIQIDVTRAITEMVGMQVGSINVHIEDIDYPPEKEA
jgi:uncharacterized alkaline shock family protein YloU